jgi:2-oxoglutarate dehydrogenase E1 component
MIESELLRFLFELLCLFHGIASGSRIFAGPFHLDELAAQRYHLLLHLGTHIEHLHDGPKFTGDVIDDDDVDTAEVRRVVFCSGKVYYDLLQRKQELQARDVALVRIEQLHPFPLKQIKAILRKYKKNMLTLFVQEEPENMGPWRYVRHMTGDMDITPVARLASGSPATGLTSMHRQVQEEIITKVFRRCTCELKNVYCGLQCVEGRSRKEVLDIHNYIEKESKFLI